MHTAGDYKGLQEYILLLSKRRSQLRQAVQAMVRLMDHSRSFEQQIRIIKESRQIDESGATMLRAAT
jgi:flagellar basal-body rod protein FlgF